MSRAFADKTPHGTHGGGIFGARTNGVPLTISRRSQVS